MVDTMPVNVADSVCLKNGDSSAHEQMLGVCRKTLPGWEQVTVADVEFATIGGGISNLNAKLSPRAGLGLEPVMFRVFGDKTDQIIDRDSETIVVIALGQQGFGPKVLALFANGRIEQWLDCTGVSPTDMCDLHMVPRIARQLRRFHNIDVDLPKAPHTPWGVTRDWLQQAKQLKFTDPVKQAAYDAIDFAALESEVDETEAVCKLTQCPVVFGHNDLLSGNMLILQKPGFDPEHPDKNGPVVFIDYEYGAYTFRDFDIGNHFTEYAGFDGNYDRYPNKQQQELFFSHYMAEDAAMKAGGSGESAEAAPLPASVMDQLSASANVWALASHLYWGIWAIIQACNSPIDFDYMKFHHTRLNEYHRRKDAFRTEARRVFGPTVNTQPEAFPETVAEPAAAGAAVTVVA